MSGKITKLKGMAVVDRIDYSVEQHTMKASRHGNKSSQLYKDLHYYFPCILPLCSKVEWSGLAAISLRVNVGSMCR